MSRDDVLPLHPPAREVGEMMVIRQAWRVVSPGFGPGDVAVRSRHAERASAEGEALRLNQEVRPGPDWYRVEPCFVLEVPRERGEPVFFDLGSPVDVR